MPLCRTRASVCTHAARCVTEHPRLMPQLMPGHLRNTRRNGCLGSSHDIGKDQWQNQIKCHLDCSERKDCLTSARQRICSSPFLFWLLLFLSPQSPPSFFSSTSFPKAGIAVRLSTCSDFCVLRMSSLSGHIGERGRLYREIGKCELLA